jgi:hypothetical protein
MIAADAWGKRDSTSTIDAPLSTDDRAQISATRSSAAPLRHEWKAGVPLARRPRSTSVRANSTPRAGRASLLPSGILGKGATCGRFRAATGTLSPRVRVSSVTSGDAITGDSKRFRKQSFRKAVPQRRCRPLSHKVGYIMGLMNERRRSGAAAAVPHRHVRPSDRGHDGLELVLLVISTEDQYGCSAAGGQKRPAQRGPRGREQLVSREHRAPQVAPTEIDPEMAVALRRRA